MRFKDQIKTSKATGRGKNIYILKQSVIAESKLILKYQASSPVTVVITKHRYSTYANIIHVYDSWTEIQIRIINFKRQS